MNAVNKWRECVTATADGMRKQEIMKTEEWIGCGISAHSPECLCDVIIRQPLPPLNEVLRDGVYDLWMGKELCDLKGYCVPWTNDKILDYLTDLEKFYDAWHENLRMGLDAEQLSDVQPLVFNEGEPQFVHWRVIREAFQYCMTKFTDSPNAIIMQLCITPQELLDALCTGKSNGKWDYNDIDKLDKLFMEQAIQYTAIADELNITVATVRGLKKYWDSRRVRGDNPAKSLMHNLATTTTMPPREVIDEVYKQYGVLYSRSTVTKTRSRAKDKQ
jgi:hypothetical protein